MAVALIVAAGRGERLGFSRPKALVPLCGRPMLQWSVAALQAVPAITQIVIALPAENLDAAPAGTLAVSGGLQRSHSVRNALAACAHGDPVVVHDAARPLATPLALRPPGTLRPLEDVLALLTAAGFSGSDALHIYRALFGFLHGHVLNELQELVEKPEETDDLLRLGLHRLPIGEFPLLRSFASVLAAYDGAAELERGLDILLTGLTTTLTPQTR